MLSAYRAQAVAMRRLTSPQRRSGCLNVDRVSSPQFNALDSYAHTACASRSALPLTRLLTAGSRQLHCSPAAHIFNVPRTASQQSEALHPFPVLPPEPRAIKPAAPADKPSSAAPTRASPTLATSAKKHPAVAPTPIATAALPPAATQVIDTSAPVASQDMGRNQPKLHFFIPTNTSAANATSASASPATPSLIATEQTEARKDSLAVLEHFVTTPTARRLLTPLSGLLQHMLPRNYPKSVTAPYTRYSQYAFLGGVWSTASGVISMQCMLFAVGLGQPLAVPAAAAVQWLLKDGLGQFGGVFFVSYINVAFDSDAKRWRMIAAMLNDCAVLIEMCTALVPALFLPLASAANIGKTITWMAASASRAAIHRSFCREENLAEVTAKAGSQITAASIVGTALGIGLSYPFGTAVQPLLAVFAVLSVLHISCTYLSLRGVPLNTLNEQRAERAMLAYCEEGRVPSTDEVREDEHFLAHYRSPFRATSRLDMTAKLTDLVADFEAMTPHLHPPPTSTATLWSTLSPLDRLLLFYHNESFLITIRPCSAHTQLPYTVSLLFLDTASSADVLAAYLLQVRFRWAVQRAVEGAGGGGGGGGGGVGYGVVCGLLRESVEWLGEHRKEFYRQLVGQGWNVEHLFLESDKLRRVHVLQTRVRAVKGNSVRQKPAE